MCGNPNTFVKVGKFEDDDFTIRFQELEEGNIIQILDKVLRTLVLHVKEKGNITNNEYQEINDISERTASRELSELVKLNVLEQAGSFGASSFHQ